MLKNIILRYAPIDRLTTCEEIFYFGHIFVRGVSTPPVGSETATSERPTKCIESNSCIHIVYTKSNFLADETEFCT